MLLALDFAALRGIEDALASTPLDDLIAVFSQSSGNRLLLVYNAQNPPTDLPDNCEALRLDDLTDVDLDTYDGLFAGISALDVIHHGLVTKGPGFYSLDRLLLKLGRRHTLHRTLRNLAHYLAAFQVNLPEEDALHRQRAAVKTPKLVLPALLDEREAEGLVAVLPGHDLDHFIDGARGRWFTVADDLELPETVRKNNDTIVAFEELSYFSPWVDSDSPHFLELRDVLRLAGQAEALRRTCWALARRLAEAAVDRPEWWKPAWALVAEAWLMVEDAQDLVAFFPHADFEHFAQTGAGLRVYRTLDEAAAGLPPGPRWSLADLRSKGVPTEFQSYGFSLVPLEMLVKPAVVIEAADLGWLLWKAGHDKLLAQTLWLLARDGLSTVAPVADFSPEILADLARRGMLLICLGNPWAWRQGRYEDLVCNSYQTLQRAFLLQAESTPREVGEYWQALAEWHHCYDTDKELDQLLRHMASHLGMFMRATRDEPAEYISDYYRNAQQLLEVEQIALYPHASVRPDEETSIKWRTSVLPGERGRLRSIAARWKADIACMSPTFEFFWGQVVALRQERRQVQTYEVNTDILHRKLTRLVTDSKRQRRLVFAPPHETAVLHYIYAYEISELERQLTELKTAARLQIVPLAPCVELRRGVNVVFEICNTGQAAAHGVDLVLETDPSFEFLERSSVRELPSLSPGARKRFSYRIRAVHEPDVTFNFSYSYEGLTVRQPLSIRLPVRSPDEAPFRMKGNPYKFGRTIQNPADFFGREEEVRQVLASLYGGGHANFLLRGPRRMGKTSMLYILKHALENPEVRRRFRIPPDWDSTLGHYTPIMLDLQAFSFQDDVTHIAHFFHALLDTLCAAIFPNIRAELLRSFDQRRREIDAPLAVLEQLKEVLQHQPEARVVVLLDEYDEIYRPQGHNLDTALRHVVQEEQRLTWVIASTQFLFKEGKSYGSPWFNILNIVELDCLAREAAWRLVEEPSQYEEVEWQSDAVVALLDETGHHPAFLQLFCSKVMAYLNQVKRNYVVPHTIATLAEQIVEEQATIHSHFEFYWTDTAGVGRLILLAADESDHPPTRKELRSWVEAHLQTRFGTQPNARVPDAKGNLVPWWEQEFKDGMAWITQVVNAISFDRASRTYTFTVPLFRRWLQRRRRYEDFLEAALDTVATEMERDGLA